jgi:hypothetical protein
MCREIASSIVCAAAGQTPRRTALRKAMRRDPLVPVPAGLRACLIGRNRKNGPRKENP